MKVVIMAGGRQSTLNESKEGIPKPMAELGGKPLLWHIMKMFASFGLREFIVCGGYKVSLIKEYFHNFYIYQSDVTIDLQNNTVEVHKKCIEDWKVTVVDTGFLSSTGQRVKMIQEFVGEEDFIVTYGDCLSNIDVKNMISYHIDCGKIATLVITKPTGRNALLPLDKNGMLNDTLEGDIVSQDLNDYAWINAYTMVFKKQIFDFLDVNFDLEKQLFIELSKRKEMVTYRHKGFWRAIETIRDKDRLEALWNNNVAPWKTW